jgi:hypothetical protein
LVVTWRVRDEINHTASRALREIHVCGSIWHPGSLLFSAYSGSGELNGTATSFSAAKLALTQKEAGNWKSNLNMDKGDDRPVRTQRNQRRRFTRLGPSSL